MNPHWVYSQNTRLPGRNSIHYLSTGIVWETPVGVDDEGHTYNINADAVAGAVAGALRARRLIMLTDVAGVLDPEGKLIQSIRVEDAAGLYENGTVTGGMIPKLNCCIDAIEQGVEKVMIVDGRVENCVLLELLTDQGVGTEIVGEER